MKRRKRKGVVGEKGSASLGKKGGGRVEVFGPAILEWVWIDPRQNTRWKKKEKEMDHFICHIVHELQYYEHFQVSTASAWLFHQAPVLITIAAACSGMPEVAVGSILNGLERIKAMDA